MKSPATSLPLQVCVRGLSSPGVPIWSYFALIAMVGFLSSCATAPKTYQPPNSTALKASTQRVSTAVTNAHQHAKEAQGKVVEASVLAKQVQTEAAALKDAPPTLVAKVNELEGKLNETTQSQTKLESDLQEADKAKAQVEKDKTDYFDSAQKLADAASQEREKRIKAESSLHWYRMHWWGAWIVFGLGILACIVLAVLKFTGKLLL